MAGREERGKGATNPAGKNFLSQDFPRTMTMMRTLQYSERRGRAKATVAQARKTFKYVNSIVIVIIIIMMKIMVMIMITMIIIRMTMIKNMPGRPCQRQRPSSELPGKSPENNYSVSKYKIQVT